MIEKGFRLAMCECGTKIKFPVKRENYGNTLNVRCPSCRTVSKVTIPVPAVTPVGPTANTTPNESQVSDFLKDFFAGKGKGFGDIF